MTKHEQQEERELDEYRRQREEEQEEKELTEYRYRHPGRFRTVRNDRDPEEVW